MSSAGLQTNVPQPTFGPNGFIVPSDDAILAGVLADLNQAFGGGLNITNLETPQGQLASSQAAVISDADQTFLFYTQQVDPAYASGRMQDAIGRIYFIERLPALQTIVSCVCTGAENTVIPVGSLAQDASGNTYLATTGGTIPASGQLTLQFANQIVGPIPCPENTLTIIYKAIPGWDSINNPSDGVLGQNTESRQAFEARRAASVAQNSVGSVPSVLGAVLNVPGVIDAYVTENDTAAPVTKLGYTMAANSLYVAVVGGDPDDVATAIWSKKAPGCAYNGNTSVTVYDTNSGYNPPYPSYTVKFETPAPLQILFAVTLVASPLIPANAGTLIANAIINAFAGADGGSRARIANNLLASRYYAPIASLGPWAQIESLYIGSNNTAGSVFSGEISGTALTVGVVASGTIAIGQVISDPNGRIVEGTRIVSGAGTSWVVDKTQTVAGASFTGTGTGTDLAVTSVTGVIGIGDVIDGTGVPGGTTIVSQTSGTPGGAGTYVTSVATTASGAAITSKPEITGAAVDKFNVQVQMDQVPVAAAANVFVSTT